VRWEKQHPAEHPVPALSHHRHVTLLFLRHLSLILALVRLCRP
jgi:hypothetical protein